MVVFFFLWGGMAPSAAVEWLDPDQSYVEVGCPKISINATVSLGISLPCHYYLEFPNQISNQIAPACNKELCPWSSSSPQKTTVDRSAIRWAGFKKDGRCEFRGGISTHMQQVMVLLLPIKVALLHMSITTAAEQGIEDDQARQLVNDAMNIQGCLGYRRTRCTLDDGNSAGQRTLGSFCDDSSGWRISKSLSLLYHKLISPHDA